jgi:hypothetical protein
MQYHHTERMNDDPRLVAMSLEELVLLARKRELIEGWEYDGEAIRLRVGASEVELRADSAQTFVRKLLQAYDRAHRTLDF